MGNAPSFLLLLVVSIFSTAAHGTSAAKYPIEIEGCPTKLSLSVPKSFTRAADPDSQVKREFILDNLHRNPGRKARYADIFLTNWKEDRGLPSVLIGSLGTAQKIQGRVTEAQWQRLKSEALSSSKSQQEQWIKRGSSQLSTYSDVKAIEAKVTAIAAEEKNSFTIFGQSSAASAGATINTYSAGKMVYANQCLINITIAVDSSIQGAYEEVMKIASQVHVW